MLNESKMCRVMSLLRTKGLGHRLVWGNHVYLCCIWLLFGDAYLGSGVCLRERPRGLPA